MKSRASAFCRVAMSALVCGTLVFGTLACGILLLMPAGVHAQVSANERVFPQSKAAVEKALKSMQANLAGHLPVLDGFAKPGEHSLDRYQRGFYQTTVQVSSTPSGGSLVHVVTKVTAWYADPVAASRSGYQLLTSNGRIESDLLDQLAEQLAGESTANAESVASVPAPNPPELAPNPSAPAPVPPAAASPAEAKTSAEPPATEPAAVDAPTPQFPAADRAPLSQGLAAEASAHDKTPLNSAKSNIPLQAEIDSLEEILKNQSHPRNLVAVKKTGTPVVATASLTAKTLFLANLHDEFEMLDFNADWVHVRISGLSRGWIWRNSVEMPDGIRDTDVPQASELAPAADLFHVMREETATFPGDWEPLRSKSVKIISVQKIDENAKEPGPKERLAYAKFLLEKNYKELAQNSQQPAGIVVIFDSADGGMIAATMPTLQQWETGALSDSALWHKCFFDPPETFDSSAPSGGSK